MIKIIEKSDKARKAIVEWMDNGELRRGVVPSEVLGELDEDEDLVSLAVPYGLDWESIVEAGLPLEVEEISKTIAKKLRAAGAWTVDDITPQLVNNVVLSAVLDYHTLMRLVKEAEV